MSIEVKVPDIGDFTDVEVIEVLVNEGVTVYPEDPLITLESDKAAMDVPAPQGGTVESVLVQVGDKVSEGTPILTLEPAASPEKTQIFGAADATGDAGPASSTGNGDDDDSSVEYDRELVGRAQDASDMDADMHAEVVVLGAGPGGYTAAFRAADLGLATILVERYPTLGGI